MNQVLMLKKGELVLGAEVAVEAEVEEVVGLAGASGLALEVGLE